MIVLKPQNPNDIFFCNMFDAIVIFTLGQDVFYIAYFTENIWLYTQPLIVPKAKQMSVKTLSKTCAEDWNWQGISVWNLICKDASSS